mmetsp:Transcript_36405/g.88027  ORF Transcript_36405/g.88027 Transcript_36405/m.88027 type:complete len:210 (+) Transcript_36405:214-843(+)
MSLTVDSATIRPCNFSRKGAEYRLLAMLPSCICESSRFSIISPSSLGLSMTGPLFLKFWNWNVIVSHRSTMVLSFSSICSSLLDPPVMSSTSSATLSIPRSRMCCSLQLSTLGPSSSIGISFSHAACTASQCLVRMLFCDSCWMRGSTSKNSSIVDFNSLYASHSRSCLGIFLQLCWNPAAVSVIESMLATTSAHATLPYPLMVCTTLT